MLKRRPRGLPGPAAEDQHKVPRASRSGEGRASAQDLEHLGLGLKDDSRSFLIRIQTMMVYQIPMPITYVLNGVNYVHERAFQILIVAISVYVLCIVDDSLDSILHLSLKFGRLRARR